MVNLKACHPIKNSIKNMSLTPEIVDFANHLADLSATVIKKYFRQNFAEKTKYNNTPVTLADQEAEAVMRTAIREKFPHHGIIGEEMENTDIDADYKWVLDPIDGTTSFVIGQPIFGTLIALIYKDQPLLGIINQPITSERWIGITDQQSTLNGQVIKTRARQKLSEAVLCTTSPAFFKGRNLRIFRSISSQTKYQRYDGVIYGGDCYLYGLLALGMIDIVFEHGLSNHDFMALIPVVKSAGGVITDWKGAELTMESNGAVLACGSANIHKKILKIIKDTALLPSLIHK
jgi:inositol-phosphate phosphatase/L-galactose 1-phosphate phosphatase/histidinol-phosphatase